MPNISLEIAKELNNKYPHRSDLIDKLVKYVGNNEEAFPSSIYIHGLTGTGKTSIIKEFFKLCNEKQKINTVYLNCVECYTLKLYLETISDAILDGQNVRAENVCEFFANLRNLGYKAKRNTEGYLIALDNAERLREMDSNLLASLLQLQQLTGFNICVIFLSQLPFEKYCCRTGLTGLPIFLHFSQYSKAETLKILSLDFNYVQSILKARSIKKNSSEQIQIINEITKDFYINYLNLFLTVFFKACRDITELRITARKYFIIYVQPVIDGEIKMSNISILWRNISSQLCSALSQIYVRIDNVKEMNTANIDPLSTFSNQRTQAKSQCSELPYYAKYLLIAAFLASHNSAKNDKRLFVKHHGKTKKRKQNINANAKVSEKLSTSLGPKPFAIDRLLAIFYAILDEKVGLTCNLLSQISTLVHLKMLCFASGENNIVEGSAKLQCTVGLEFIIYVGKLVGFNVRQYLCDFM